jgi:RNA polymerase sigma-70 factor (ECF subfamily)
MATHSDPDTDALVNRAASGDQTAREQLLGRHRPRLRRMVATRMDRRLAARFDPSDVVQEALIAADARLSEYLRRRPVPFYPWLRQLTWERLVELHRRHLGASKRSVRREDRSVWDLPEDSAAELATRLVDTGIGPGSRLLRDELRQRVRAALDHLPAHYREVLIQRHLEQLTSREIATVLGISENAVNVRHLRALERLRYLLEADGPEGTS